MAFGRLAGVGVDPVGDLHLLLGFLQRLAGFGRAVVVAVAVGARLARGGERAEEHQLTLHAWSRQGGHREAHLITGALMQVLDDAPLMLEGHHLVTFRFAVADVRRENDGRTYHALLRFRAVTEPV